MTKLAVRWDIEEQPDGFHVIESLGTQPLIRTSYGPMDRATVHPLIAERKACIEFIAGEIAAKMMNGE